MGTWNDYEDSNLTKEVEDIEKNGGGEGKSYRKVPPGTYEVAIRKMLPTKSKSGKDMLTIWFEILTGPYAKNKLFSNTTLTSAFSIHKANELLRGLAREIPGMHIRYVNRAQYENLILDVFEAISNHFEYAVTYSENDKGYSEFEIKEIFVLE